MHQMYIKYFRLIAILVVEVCHYKSPALRLGWAATSLEHMLSIKKTGPLNVTKTSHFERAGYYCRKG